MTVIVADWICILSRGPRNPLIHPPSAKEHQCKQRKIAVRLQNICILSSRTLGSNPGWSSGEYDRDTDAPFWALGRAKRKRSRERFCPIRIHRLSSKRATGKARSRGSGSVIAAAVVNLYLEFRLPRESIRTREEDDGTG